MSESLVPLFVLDVVLFPGMVLPLRIFEPRYQLMIRRCIETDRRFGVILRRSSDDPGAPEQPHGVGTVAEISGWEVLANGHIMLVCVGLTRFRVLEVLHSEPYMQARVTPFDDHAPGPDGEEDFVAQVRQQVVAYTQLLQQLSNAPVVPPSAGIDLVELGYYLAALLQIDNTQKQPLLELQAPLERLKEASKRLDIEMGELQGFVSRASRRGDYFYRGRRLSRN